MSLRTPQLKPATAGTHEHHLAHVLAAGQQHRVAQNASRKSAPSTDRCIDATIRSRMVPTGSIVLAALGPPAAKPATVATTIERLAAQLAEFGVSTDVNTGKRKVDGNLAAARVGQTTTQRWANERFRQ
eukprot:2851486-Prymnesium_polylepis.1